MTPQETLQGILGELCYPPIQEYYHPVHHKMAFKGQPGIVVGTILEIIGSHSSGKTTLAKSFLANVPKENRVFLDIANSPQQEGIQADTLQTATKLILENLERPEIYAILWDNSNLYQEPEYPDRSKFYAKELQEIAIAVQEAKKILVRVSLSQAETIAQMKAGRMTHTEADFHSRTRVGVSYPHAILLKPAYQGRRNWAEQIEFNLSSPETKGFGNPLPDTQKS